jgi:hypothetical protein
VKPENSIISQQISGFFPPLVYISVKRSRRKEMKYLYKIIFLLVLILLTTNVQAGIYWVGSSAACSGGNVQATLLQALALAAFNGDAVDEIRLTNTVAHTGNTNGNFTLTDWDSGGRGVLTIVGGYADCFTSPSGKTLVGNSGTSSFTINTDAEANSIVTLKNLYLSNNASRGLVVRGGGIVTLDNVEISNNGFTGVDIGDGGYVEILSNSAVRGNNNIDNPIGGGVRCTGTNSSAVIHGILEANRAQKGGNLYVSTGCYVQLKDGMRIIGGAGGGSEAVEGGGAYIDNGGSLFADGRANRVIFDNNIASTNGGALFLNGTGFALLQNTHFNGSAGNSGAAIYAKDGGTASPQLIMDQTTDCSLLFRCSEIQGTRHKGSVVVANDSVVQISRTVVELSNQDDSYSGFTALLIAFGDGKLRLNRVGVLRNEVDAILAANSGLLEATHVTVAANFNEDGQDSKSLYLDNGTINIRNSIINNTSGADPRGGGNSIIGGCNLLDDDADWPAGIYDSGFAQFINAAGGDARQTAGSLGVDMCNQDSFAWSSEVDIENEAAPVNESTNPQGMPGDVGGLYDAGFDEVYDNVGPAFYLLSITKQGSGSGHVFNNSGAIDCGSFCSAQFEEDTTFTIAANPDSGSVFTAWHNCPSVSGNLCFIQMNSNLTIGAEFNLKPTNLIFSDGFE